MKPKLLTTFLLIVIVPLVLLGWLGTRVAKNERDMVRQRFRELLERDLGGITGDVSDYLYDVQAKLLEKTESPLPDKPSVREIEKSLGIVDHAFLLNATGELTIPDPNNPLTIEEERFIARTAKMWADKHEWSNAESGEGSRGASGDHGWRSWYWEEGLRLLFWQRLDSGEIVGVELNRPRFIADLIGALPDTDPFLPELEGSRIALRDSAGDALYQWGEYDPGEDEQPIAQRALDPPLGSWRLTYHLDVESPGQGLGHSVLFSGLAATVASVLVVLVLAVYFYREQTREIREAGRRVTFVNQVSHELKTPLTNVRMYAELLERNLPEADEKSVGYLGVIVDESRRLSRLIGNILTFGRKTRSQLEIHRTPNSVDEVVENVLKQFAPTLARKEVEVEKSLDADGLVDIDRDALEQILGNLLSNVEKYASSGGYLKISTRGSDGETTIEVEDRGPGIPVRERERIFAPFHRIGGELTEGVSGAGIGLSIARDLARLHDGDLTLEPCERGAKFRVVLETRAAKLGDDR